MKLIQGALRSLNIGYSHRFQLPHMIRALSTGGYINPNSNSFESSDDFEQRILGDFAGNTSNSKSSFYEKLGRSDRAHDRMGYDTKSNGGFGSEHMDGLDESFNTLSDGMDGKLKAEASYFGYDELKLYEEEDYVYRPDVNFDRVGETYEPKDLDLRKPGVWKPPKSEEFCVTTEEVLSKADFRNVRFLANFITDAGIIIKRSKTKISAKAQRKVAREIKTARAFGLMPFTTMGTKHFVFGRTMESRDEDYAYESYNNINFVDEEASQNPL